MANTVFEIQGTFKFASELAKCSFHCESGGHKTVQIGAIAFSTGTIAQCKLSTPLPVGFCHVTLSQNGVRVSRNSFQILVHSPVLISRVTPSTSTTVGGTLVTIEGSGFPANIQPLCHFGNLNIVKATAVSSNRLTCTTPAMRMPNNTAIVDMWITFGGIESLIQPFKFSAPISIVTANPSFGPADGGTRVKIEGINIFPEVDIKCLFDGNITVVPRTINQGRVLCTTPSIAAGLHTLELIVEGGSKISSNFVHFEAIPREQVFQIHPSRGIQTETTERKIRVIGDNFVDSMTLTCVFDDAKAPATDFISSSELECVVPFTKLGMKVVRVSNNGVDFSKSSAVYEVLSRMSIATVSPHQGSFLGGTIVAISGVFGKYEGIECVFGEKSVAARVINASVVECIAPSGKMGEVVKISARVYNTLAHIEDDVDVSYEYSSGPIVTDVIPSIVSQTTKLTNVTVVGSGLNVTEFIGCQFSNQPMPRLYRDGGDSVWCSFDARFTGVYELTLALVGNTRHQIVTHHSVRVIPAIQPIDISPLHFDEKGGTAAIISALNIISGAKSLRCLFGNIVVDGLALSEFQVRCMTPPIRPGRMSLRLSQDGFSWSDKTLEIEAFAMPMLFEAYPNRTAAIGGASIVVYGTNLRPFSTMKCVFGDIKTPAISVNASIVKCITPTLLTAGTLSLGVSLNGIEVSGNTVDVEFYDLPSGLFIRSFKELHDGRWSARIEGSNISSIDEYECLFDSKPSTGLARNVTSYGLDCISDPLTQQTRPKMLTLTLHGEMLLQQDVTMNIGCPSSVYGLLPTVMRPGYSNVIFVAGFRFDSSMDLACHIGQDTILGGVKSENTMQCALPAKIPGNYTLEITCAAGSELLGAFHIQYANPPRIERVRPHIVPTGGSFDVDFFGANFARDDLIYCAFGSSATRVQAFFISAYHLRCSTRRNWMAGQVELSVVLETLEGRTERLYQSPFTFVDSIPETTVLKPDFGSAAGGYSINVELNASWSGYENRSCKFVGVDAEFEGVLGTTDTESLGCQVPRLKPGSYSVLFSPNGRDFLSIRTLFTAHVPIQVEKVNPPFALSTRKIDLTVSGKGFQRWMRLRCGFRGAQEQDWVSSNAEYVSRTKVKCEAPNQMPTTGSFQLLPTTSLLFPLLLIPFEYKSEIIIHSISPDNGSTSGGTIVDIVGQGFSRDLDMKCRVQGESSIATFVNATLIRCRTPASRSMTVPIHFTIGDLNVLEEYFMFTYVTLPEISDIQKTSNESDGNIMSVDTMIDPMPPRKYEPKPSIRFIEPMSGWIRGGTAVVVHGFRMIFSHTIECVFGDVSVFAAFVSSQELECISPHFTKPGRHNFIVRSEGEQWEMVTPLWFNAFSLPSILSTEPKYGDVTGGTNVVVKGNFSSSIIQENVALFCAFGETGIAPSRFMSKNELECTSPPAEDTMTVEMGLFFSAKDILQVPFSFHYTEKPEFMSLSPAIVSEHIGEFVTIFGVGFLDSGAGYCSYSGNSKAHYDMIFVSDEEIRCLLPRLKPGLESISVSFNGDTVVSTGLLLTIKAKPTLLSMTPQFDSVYGGAVVEFRGLNLFFAESLRCLFGTLWSDAALYSGKITCAVPPSMSLSSSSRVSVSVVSGAEDYATEKFELVYTLTPQIESIEIIPDIGRGFQRIQLCGAFPNISSPHFLRLDTFDESTEENYIVMGSAGEILNSSCQVFKAGPTAERCSSGCDALLSVNNQTFIHTGKHVKLTPMIRILRITPMYGSFRGDEIIRIEGRNWNPLVRLYCVFDGSLQTIVTVLNSKYAECETNSHSAGSVALKIVVVEESGAAHIVRVFNFTFVGAMEIANAAPLIGLTRGGSQVHVRGKGFVNRHELRCRFGEISVPAHYVNNSYVTCVSPPVFKAASKVPFSVSLGQISTSNTNDAKVTFSYINTPLIQSIEPSSGMYNKNHSVKIFGTGFVQKMTTACRFGMDAVNIPATTVASNELTCMVIINSTGHQKSRMLPIGLSISGGTYFETGFSFTVFGPVVLTGAVPNAIIPTQTDRIKLECLDVFPSRDWQCRFDSLNVTTIGRFVSRTTVSCLTPPARLLKSRTLVVRLLNAGIEYSINAVEVEILQPPEIFDYTPKSRGVYMSSAPGEDIVDYVTITGKNFVPFRRIDCRFGSLCSQGTFISSTQIRCRIPMSTTPRRVSLAVSFNEVDLSPASEFFEYLMDFMIESISPINGAISGGTVVHIYGGEFSMNETIVCSFGDYNSDQYAIVSSSTEIICTSPSVLKIGNIDVVIWSVTRRLRGTLSNAFTYTKEPVVLMVSPTEAIEKTETLFNVYGRGFVRSPLLGCTFSGDSDNTGQLVHAIWVSSTHIKCYSPPANISVGDIQIGLTNNGVDFVYASSSAIIHFRTKFDVSEIFPSAGSTEGGTAVYISGKHFDNAYRCWCRFGNYTDPVEATIVSDEELICITPPFAFITGEVVVYLSVNGRDFVSTKQTFSYHVKPQIFKISPTRGSMDASTLVTVTGEGFYSESPLCKFGETIVQAYVESDSELQCVAPTNRFAEAVSVEVSLNDGVDFTQNGVLYTYVLSPRIRQITPVSGPATGGTLMQITGLNLYSSRLTQCCFGDRYHCTQGWLLNATVIECITPPSPAKLSVTRVGSQRLPILLALNGQDFVTLKMQFEYVLDAIIEDVSPTFGDIDGGTMIFLHGRYFRYSTGLECRFDNIRTFATYWNDSTISCEAPPHPIGNTSLSFSLNGQDFTLAASSFTYLRLPSVYTVTPSTGPLAGGYSICINGALFMSTTKTICQFIQDDETFSETIANYESPAGVSCIVPPGKHSGRGLISLFVNGISAARLQNMEFLYYDDVVLHRLEPWLCDSSGGCNLVIFGANFRRDAEFECCFGSSELKSTCARAEFLSDTRLNCISPSLNRVGSVEVSIRSYGVEVSSRSLLLEVHHPIVMDKVYPVTGTYRGGTKVIITGWHFMFTPQLSCCFDDTQVPATFVNSSMIECSTPYVGIKSTSVRVSMNGQDCLNGGAVQTFTFQLPPSILQVTPNSGTRLGGTTVLVHGENFKVNESTCYFGSTPATVSEVLSATQMKCTSPAQTNPQRLQVVVADNNLDYSTNPVFFTYSAAEEVKSVSPVRMPSIKGGRITVITENARNSANLSCFFDHVAVPAIYESSSKVHCSTPSLTPGFFNLYVSNDGKLKSQSFGIIELVKPPLIASVDPLIGDMEGGELVSFVGSRLNTVSHCRFGNVYASAYVVSPNLLQCESPSQATFGNVVVKLLDHGAEIPSQEIRFTYRTPEQATKRRQLLMKDKKKLLPIPMILSIDPPEAPIIGGTLITVTNDGKVFSNSPTSILVYTDAIVEYISPTHGPQTGGTAVTVFGMHFRKGSHLRCKFGDLEAVQVEKYVSSTEVVCFSPPQRDLTTVVRVAVTNNNSTFTPNPVFFTYTTTADLVSITPKFGGISGGTELLIRWYNLEINYDGVVTCRIGGINTIGQVLASNVVKCVTPTVKQPGKQLAQVSVNGLSSEEIGQGFEESVFTTPSLYFEFVEDIVIYELIPNLGPSIDANTVMTVRGRGFMNSVDLACIFRSVKVPATFINPTMISCAVPRDSPGKVTIRVTNNGMDASTSSASYLYVKDMSVTRLLPSKGLKEGGTTVFFQ
ncbi:hypothetical protein F444_06572, partial [Phytophthora nicotianae P1976]